MITRQQNQQVQPGKRVRAKSADEEDDNDKAKATLRQYRLCSCRCRRSQASDGAAGDSDSDSDGGCSGGEGEVTNGSHQAAGARGDQRGHSACAQGKQHGILRGALSHQEELSD